MIVEKFIMLFSLFYYSNNDMVLFYFCYDKGDIMDINFIKSDSILVYWLYIVLVFYLSVLLVGVVKF